MKSCAITIGLLIFLGSAASGSAQHAVKKNSHKPSIGRSKDDNLRKLVVLVGAVSRGEQLWRQMLPMMKHAAPDVPDIEWKEIDKEFSAELTSGGFVETIVAIYSAHLTALDVEQLIAFYESPIGKKLISVSPNITQEAMIAGHEQGQRIIKQVYEKLRKKGYSVPTA